MASTASPSPARHGAKPTRTRHLVLWLIVAAYMITYIDRVTISTAAPSIEAEFGFSQQEMGWILGSFQIAYAIFQIPGGWLGDRFGPRAALTGVVTWWSTFTAATSAMWSGTSLIVCRFLFGMGEAGAFPIATRSLSRWMLPSERGWAQGLTHAGSRLGAATTPALVALLIATFGWRMPFHIFAVVGLCWAVLWWFFYRNTPAEHSRVNEAERALIENALGAAQQKAGGGKVPWRRILSAPQMWFLCLMYFCYGWGIVIFLQWFPTYLSDARGMELKTMGIAASIPLMAGVIGDIAGGSISDRLLKKSGRIKMARRIVPMIGFAIAAVTIPMAALSTSDVGAIAWFGLAVFGLELVVGVAWAITLDIGGEYAGSVSALMNTAGNIAGATGVVATGYLVAQSGWESAFFVLSGLSIAGLLFCLKVDAGKKLA